MEKVIGIGGVFFRAQDPQTLAKWYRDMLGAGNEGDEPWQQAAGPTVFAPFPKDTEYFGRPEQMWMINFRVENLDAMAAQLRAAGIEITIEDFPFGRFGRLQDPEGNPIELWQPM
jgi:predicted enzyme related to lactoylglutathione lyase